MRVRGSWVAASAIVAACVAWIGSGLIGGGRRRPPAASAKTEHAVRVGVIEMRARPVTARLDIARTGIAAPFAGMIDTRPVEIGTLVAVDDAVATLVELDPIKIEVEVSEGAIGGVRVGAAAEVRRPGIGGGAGVVTYIGHVEIEAPNPDRRIAAGMTAEVSLPLGETLAHPVSPAVLTLSATGELGVKAVNARGLVEFHKAVRYARMPKACGSATCRRRCG